MRKQKLPPKQDLVKVIRDCSNGLLDYYIPRARAKVLYNEGKLNWDITNGTYCTDKWDSNAKKHIIGDKVE